MIIIACGGTGGHIYPGLAVAKHLEEKGASVRFIGSDSRMEKDKIPQEGYAFDGLPVQQLKKKTPFRSGFALLRSFLSARRILKAYRPEAVVGFGSYITVPTILAAASLRIPIGLIETNVVAGKANRVMGKLATFVTLAYEKTAAEFPSTPTHLVGSPIRPDFQFVSRQEGASFFELDPNKKVISILGGSQGAQKINEILIKIIPNLIHDLDLQIVHVCGPLHIKKMEASTQEYAGHPQYRLLHYVENMPALLACTDLAISRAGASALAEFLACQVPSILIPGTFGGGHQKDNAIAIEEGDAAVMLLEKSLNAEALLSLIEDVMMDTERLERMQQNCSRLNPLNAAEAIANLVLKHTTHQKEDTLYA